MLTPPLVMAPVTEPPEDRASPSERRREPPGDKAAAGGAGPRGDRPAPVASLPRRPRGSPARHSRTGLKGLVPSVSVRFVSPPQAAGFVSPLTQHPRPLRFLPPWASATSSCGLTVAAFPPRHLLQSEGRPRPCQAQSSPRWAGKGPGLSPASLFYRIQRRAGVSLEFLFLTTFRFSLFRRSDVSLP